MGSLNSKWRISSLIEANEGIDVIRFRRSPFIYFLKARIFDSA